MFNPADYHPYKLLPDDDPAQEITIPGLIRILRSLAGVIATLLFGAAFWWPGVSWRDGPPDASFFITTFYLPLAIGLACAVGMLRQPRVVEKLLGLFCLAVCGSGLVVILVETLIFLQGVWLYNR